MPAAEGRKSGLTFCVVGIETYFSGMETRDVEQEDDDRDLPDPSDMDEHDEPDLLPCPNCRRMINEDADWCHHCKQYVTHDPAQSKWRAIVVGAILATMALGTLAWLFSR
jgi:hypothetical protein